MTPATAERHRLADTFLAAGPDAPTLCDPWTTRDLAAHLVIRERRPDAAVGILAKPFAKHTDKVQAKVASSEWTELVELVRDGPPVWAPSRIDAVDRAINTTEFFVHHEDVLRAVDGWAPRQIDPELTFDLAGALRRAKLFVRKSPVGIVLAPTDGGGTFTAKQAEPSVTVTGPVGELVLWTFGRQAHAVVDYDGPAEAIETVRTSSFGI
ncbi:MAG TPA: TIGR03085 family metal-binding protein [Ilumatobacter sp.]|nr:TIGR03085 family metal-binding protein [Ilumatobacter sp.]